MNENKVVNLSPNVEEKRWELFLTHLTKELFGSAILLQLPNWKYKGTPVQPQEIILLQLSGWKKLMFSISDIMVDQINIVKLDITSHTVVESKRREEEVRWKTEALKSIRGLFWSIIKLKYFPGKELTAKSLDGEVVLVEFFGSQRG